MNSAKNTNLMIVESPSKCKTLKNFLGDSFAVLACYGHVRDLPSKKNAVEPDNNFQTKFIDIERNQKHIREIIKAVKQAKNIYLATDPDREGEAISSHIVDILAEKNLTKDKAIHRISFNEINKGAVQEALEHPRELSRELIEAQKTRRILDHLVGFNLSPLLWKKIHQGLSAGRVQSPSLRLIVEREEEIEKFITQEYWLISALCNEQKLVANLTHFNNEKLTKFSIGNQKQADETRQQISADCNNVLTVGERTSTERKLRPQPPYMTSTLLQDAANKLGFDQRRTMRVAQRLYEGVDINSSSTSLITYMRTDSLSLSKLTLEAIRQTIGKTYDAAYLADKPRYYKNKSKNTQEAHEAIRPNNPHLIPSQVKGKIGNDEWKLYALIWSRAVGSQMTDSITVNEKLHLDASDKHKFQLSVSRIVFDGHLKAREQMHGFSAAKDTTSARADLPNLDVGQTLKLSELKAEQKFTKPPARYNVASLVETLDKHGIGRPSTYASIVSILESRGYVTVKDKSFHPTETGIVVNQFLTKHFEDYVDYAFTSNLEAKLDDIANGRQDWLATLQGFWVPFHQLVEEKNQSVQRNQSINERVLGVDPESGRTISVRIGRYGSYAQIGVKEDEDKPRFAPLPPNIKLSEIDLEGALHLFELPRKLGETEDAQPILVAIGRFGPYVRFGDRFAALASEDDPYTIDLPRALELIEKRKELDRKRTVKSFDGEEIRVMRSRFGFTIAYGQKKKNLPKDYDVDKLTKSQCLELLETEKSSNSGKKKSARSSKRTTSQARKPVSRSRSVNTA